MAVSVVVLVFEVPQVHIAVAMAIGKTLGADVRRKIAAIPEYVWC
jgi:hypothetical protein